MRRGACGVCVRRVRAATHPSSIADERSMHRVLDPTATPLARRSISIALTPPTPDSTIASACSATCSSSPVARCSAGTVRPRPARLPASASTDEIGASE